MDRKDIKPFDWRWLDRRGNYLTIVTPELTEQLLERNTNNRRPRPLKIAQFARDMENDRWDPDASDLKFAADGTLLDGQNRLLACLRAQKPFATLVRTGLAKETQRHVDTGTARTASDALKMAGITYGAALASAVTLRIRFEDRLANHQGKRGMDAKGLQPTHDEVIDYLGEHPQMEKWAGRGDSLSTRVMPSIQRSVVMAGLSWFAEVDEADTVAFCDSLFEGEFGGPGDPRMALISYAARNSGPRKQGSPGSRGRVAQEENLMALIKVWNAWREGEPIKLLSIRRSEAIEPPR
jgi:hypothetical protein